MKIYSLIGPAEATRVEDVGEGVQFFCWGLAGADKYCQKKFSVVKSPISYPLARRNSSFYLELFVCSCEQFRTTSFYSTMSRCIGSNKETMEAHCHLLARKMKNLKKALSMRVQNEKSGFHHKVKLSAGQW